MKKVLKCGCARSCYRASFRQVFTTTMFGEQKNFNKTLEKVTSTQRVFLFGFIGVFFGQLFHSFRVNWPI